MARINKFEDIVAWQKSRELSVLIYQHTSREKFKSDFDLIRQIRRASVSVVSNIAEGFEREGRKEFIQFLSIAKASCGEIRAQLYLAMDLEYLTESEFNLLKEKATEVSKLVSGLMNYLKQSEYKGTKFQTGEPEVEYLLQNSNQSLNFELSNFKQQ